MPRPETAKNHSLNVSSVKMDLPRSRLHTALSPPRKAQAGHGRAFKVGINPLFMVT